MSSQWRESLAGARMQVDQQFNDRVLNSQFTNQEWGLIMTAVEFEIENPDDPERAELIANTENVTHIIPELENLPKGMGTPPATDSRRGGGGGILASIRNMLGGGGGSGVDEDTLEAATALVDEYAVELQQFLEEQGRWREICNRASTE